MGRGDNRRTPKMRRRTGQERKKRALRKLEEVIKAKGVGQGSKSKDAPMRKKSSAEKVEIKRGGGGQRKTVNVSKST